MEAINKCTCGVPHDYHATACGWKFANINIDDTGIIVFPKEHPGYGKHFGNWEHQDDTILDLKSLHIIVFKSSTTDGAGTYGAIVP